MRNRFAQLFDVDGRQVLVMIEPDDDSLMTLAMRTMTGRGITVTTFAPQVEDQAERYRIMAAIVASEEVPEQVATIARQMWQAHGVPATRHEQGDSPDE